MIMSVDEVRGILPALDWTDERLTFWLKGIEQAIKSQTNNDFNRYRGEDGEIVWPDDIKLGIVGLLKWEIGTEGREGVASETISRHSVSYVAQTGADSIGGYPAYLMGFTRPYERARF